jgi:hypothetical protein
MRDQGIELGAALLAQAPAAPSASPSARSSIGPFPVSDWEFWVATAIFLFAVGFLLRNTLPIPWLSARLKRKRHERRVTLTVEGQRPEAQSSKAADQQSSR